MTWSPHKGGPLAGSVDLAADQGDGLHNVLCPGPPGLCYVLDYVPIKDVLKP